MPFASRPIICVSAALAAGCLLAIATQPHPHAALVVALVACGAAVYGYATGARGWLLLIVAVIALGAGRAALFQSPGQWDVSRLIGARDAPLIEGYVSNDPVIRTSNLSFHLRVTHASIRGREIPVNGRLAVTVARNALPEGRLDGGFPEYGRMLRLEGRVVTPREARRPGEFSYRSYLRRQGIFSCVWLHSRDQLKPLTSRRGNAASALALQTRQALQQVLEERLPEAQAGLVSGMLLGSYSLVPEELVENFTRTGTLHLLAASGFNCALIVYLFWILTLKRIGAPRKPAVLLVIGLLVFYILMVGGKPSIVRAGVGASLFMGALLLGRPAHMVSVLFATVLIMLVYNPLSIADAGFQLSFAAVAAIVAFAPLLEPALGLGVRDEKTKVSLWRYPVAHLAQASLITTCASVATAPIIAYYFNRLSLVSLPANLMVALLAELLFVFSSALSLLFWLPGVDWLLTRIVGVLAAAVGGIVNTLGNWEYAEIEVRSPGFLWMSMYFAALSLLWQSISRRVRPTGGAQDGGGGRRRSPREEQKP